MPLLAIVIGLVAGFAVWGILDHIQGRAVHRIFQRELRSQLDQRSRENLIRFEQFLESYATTARLLANHRQLAEYLESKVWFPDEPTEPVVYRELRPAWLPDFIGRNALVPPSHVLLADAWGRIREAYYTGPQPVPREMDAGIDAHFLSETDVLTVLTRLDAVPYLLVSDAMEDGRGYPMGYLVVLVPVNDAFLAGSQRGSPLGGAILSLVDADDQRILVSSSPHDLLAGSLVDEWLGDYQITFQSLTHYEGADWNVMFATFLPHDVVATVAKRVGQFERRQRVIAALAFITVFTLVIFLVSARLNRVLKRMSRFAQRALGIQQLGPEETGNQLLLLEEWMQRFGQMVLKTREEMRQRHESEIRQSEALKTAILEASLDPIITINEEGSVIECNPTAQRVFGLERDQVLGRSFAELLIAPSDRERFQSLLRSSGEPSADSAEHYAGGELTARHAVRGEVPVEVSIVPIRLGHALVYTVYMHDISKRRQAEREIQSLARFASESPSPTLRVTRKGTLVYANAASVPVMAYWGCKRGQTLPLYWRGLVTRALDENRGFEHVVDCDGQIFSLLLAPVRELNYVNIYGRDITEVRHAEQEARQHQAELVHVCRLSTMGEVATGMAHELNQPLSAIVNYANGCSRRLQGGFGNKKQLLAAMQQITAQAERASEIIRRLRALVAKQPPLRAPVDLNHLIREVCSFVEYDSSKLQVSIELDLTPRPIAVNVDLVQIEQVLLNLVRNALDALQEVPVDRRRLCVGSTSEEGRARVKVSDSGNGIGPERLGRLFDPFFTTKPTGMGMGLPISQTIVHDHAGHIWVHSEPGIGTDFYIELPLIEALPQAAQVAGMR